MRIAITVWGNRISPVFESSENLMVVKIENYKITRQKILKIVPKTVVQAIEMMKKKKADILICGAITERDSQRIRDNGIHLVSFISGNTDKILETYVRDKTRVLDFSMPGFIPKGMHSN